MIRPLLPPRTRLPFILPIAVASTAAVAHCCSHHCCCCPSLQPLLPLMLPVTAAITAAVTHRCNHCCHHGCSCHCCCRSCCHFCSHCPLLWCHNDCLHSRRLFLPPMPYMSPLPLLPPLPWMSPFATTAIFADIDAAVISPCSYLPFTIVRKTTINLFVDLFVFSM